MSLPVLLVLCGPTASGKTSLAIRLARHYKTDVLSSDSRQFYRQLNIGTAKPTPAELASVKHHFIDFLSLEENYNISRYEQDALECLEKLFKLHRLAILAGGSGLYMQAVCEGLDRLPESDPNLRSELNRLFATGGLDALQEKLRILDPEYYAVVDRSNPHRLIRALEVCLLTGGKYSTLRRGKKAQRNFAVLKIGLQVEREALYGVIDERVDAMMASGLEEEARSVVSFRSHQALNTVGYKELFEYFDGKTDRTTAIGLIKQHTRNYARRQLTWFRRDPAIRWFQPTDEEKMLKYVDAALGA